MVQADITQLSAECSNWRTALRNSREDFNQCKQQLQQMATQPMTREDLTAVEHFQNQFHIQLINIHDLKQAIKQHERKAEFETTHGHIHDETYADHEQLLEEYQQLNNTLQEVKEDFNHFLRSH